MSAILAFLTTGVITFMNIGFDTGFPLLGVWAFVVAWPIALAMVLLLGLHVWKLVNYLCIRDG